MTDKLPEVGQRYKGKFADFPDFGSLVINKIDSEKVYYTEHWESSSELEPFLETMEEIPEQEPVKPTSEWQDNYYTEDWWCNCEEGVGRMYDECSPTHWMPLPKPPVDNN